MSLHINTLKSIFIASALIRKSMQMLFILYRTRPTNWKTFLLFLQLTVPQRALIFEILPNASFNEKQCRQFQLPCRSILVYHAYLSLLPAVSLVRYAWRTRTKYRSYLLSIRQHFELPQMIIRETIAVHNSSVLRAQCQPFFNPSSKTARNTIFCKNLLTFTDIAFRTEQDMRIQPFVIIL